MCVLTSKTLSQNTSENFITYDIDNFWIAYDKIISTKDTIKQYEYINKLFIQKGSEGLKAIMEVRNYTDKSYIEAINNYPLFWNSIRKNTLKAKDFAEEIKLEIDKLKILYPNLKPAKIYFTIGALRTGGTTMNGMVLIGSEIALADNNTITTEFSQEMSHLRPYFDTNPINSVAFGNIHEYIHTQQKTTIGNNLLAQSLLEGVAEFITVLVTEKTSTAPAIDYGKKNNIQVRDKFSSQMFNSFTSFWLYSNAKNEFNVRDLGYYVGYAICEGYYKKIKNKKEAIKQMIELDYNDRIKLENFVQKSGYFSEKIKKIEKQFENDRPKVIGITQFKNGDENVNANLKQITIEFSKPMDERFRSFELGPLGEKNLLLLKRFIEFSADKKSISFEIDLKPNQHYQILVNSGFRNKGVNSLSLKPYLIDFKTKNK